MKDPDFDEDIEELEDDGPSLDPETDIDKIVDGLKKKEEVIDVEKPEERERRKAFGVELLSKISNVIEAMQAKFYRTISINGYVEIDFKELLQIDTPVADALLDDYGETQKGFELIINDKFADTRRKLGKDIEVRFSNLIDSCQYQIYQLRAHLTNQLIKVKCVIRATSAIMTRVTSIRWECHSCGNVFTTLQTTKKVKRMKCACGGNPRPLNKETIDIQTLEVEELPENMSGIQQSMQRYPVLIQGTMTDPTFSTSLQPGNRIELIGSIIEQPLYFRNDEEVNIITHMFIANNIQVLEMEYENLQLNEEDIKQIEKEAKDPDVLIKLRDSIAPEIYGMEDAKKTLILQAVEGVEKKTETGHISRGKIHILMIGDPATAKSKLLEVMYDVAPKARYAVGGATTKAGITAGAVRDETTKQWALEAGAMVLAHKGLFILDEADKMTQEDSGSLHEGMAQGTITKTVSGVNARLPASCSVLAAANPKYSRFDRSKPIGTQIEMPISLLSRFDVIYPVFDIPGEIDEKIADHILTVHRQPKKIEPPYQIAFVRKYLAHAKKQRPKLTAEVHKYLKDYYTELRKSSMKIDEDGKVQSPIPITARQLEALIRLSEASAKIRLDSYVREQDALQAKKIFISCMEKVGVDSETGTFDVDMITSTVAASERGSMKKTLKMMQELSDEYHPEPIPDTAIIEKMAEYHLTEEQTFSALARLSKEGEVFQPKKGYWQLIK